MPLLTIYTLSNCDSCRAALKWLRAREIQFVEKPIRATPPTAGELRQMLDAQGGELRRLCNTAGKDYRDLKLGEKIPAMTESAVLKLLSGNGNLVKRPFLVGPEVALVGFDEDGWKDALTKK